MTGPTITQEQRAVLMKITGARMANNAFKAVFAAGQTVWVEARKRRGIHETLKNPRRLMGSEVQGLIELGYLRQVADGSSLLIEQTDLRP